MEYLIQNLPPEVICTRITDEALSLLALAGEKAIPTIAPLEAALPLTAKAWKLPGSLLKEKTDLLERGKAQAAAGGAVLTKEPLLESYDGWEITLLLWNLFQTAVRLEDREERHIFYAAAQLLEEALDYHCFLYRTGENYLKMFWGMFRNMVRKSDPEKRKAIFEKAYTLTNRLCRNGIDRSV